MTMIASLFSLLIVPWVQGSTFLSVNSSTAPNEPPCQASNILSCEAIVIDFNAVWNGVIDFNGVSLTKTMTIPVSNPNLEAGQFKNGNDYYAILTYSTQASGTHRMNGVVTTPTQTFSIEHCGGGGHVLIEQDTSGFSDDPALEGDQNMFSSGGSPASPDVGGPIVYSILFYYTPGFADTTPDIEGFVNTIIAETNAGYANSEVNLQAEIRCIELEDSTKLSDYISEYNLRQFTKIKGSLNETLNTADVAMLLTKDIAGQDNCGMAWNPGRTSLAAKHCAIGYFTAGHEIAHNFGCHHDRFAPGLSSLSPGYGYGYQIGYPTQTDKRTIMAYRKPGWTQRVNHYSSDTVLYDGNATGNAYNDNARMLTENAAQIANYGDESGTCVGSTTVPPTTTTTTTTNNSPCENIWPLWYCEDVPLFDDCDTQGEYCRLSCDLCDSTTTTTTTTSTTTTSTTTTSTTTASSTCEDIWPLSYCKDLPYYYGLCDEQTQGQYCRKSCGLCN